MQSKQAPAVIGITLLVVAALTGCGGKDADELIASGRHHLEQGETKTAIVEFKQALQDKPDAPATRLLLGQALLASGDSALAVVELRKAQEGGVVKATVAPLMAKALIATGGFQKVVDDYGTLTIDDSAAAAELDTRVATAYTVLGDTAKAQSRLERALQRNPDLPEALLLQARLSVRAGKADLALEQISNLLARHPKEIDARMLSGDIKFNVKSDADGAVAEYSQVLALQPDQVGAHSALISLYLKQNRIDAARAQLQKLKAAQPKSLRAKFFEAQLAVVDKDFPKARELVQALLRAVPENGDVLYLGGVTEMGLGNVRAATAHLSKALASSPGRIDVRMYLAQVYLKSGQGDKAFDTLKTEVANERAEAPMLAMAAQALLQRGDFDRARDMFQRAAKAEPGDAKVLTSLAVLNYSMGDQSLAFQQLQSISGNDQDAVSDQALIALLAKKRDFDGALRAIDGLARKNVAPALAPYLRGKIELQRHNIAAARKYFEAALAKNPAHMASTTELAELDLADGKTDAAQGRFETLLKADSKSGIALAEIARIRSRAGADKDEVTRRLGDAIKVDPGEAKIRIDLIDYLISKRDATGAVAAAQDALAVFADSEEILNRLGRAQMLAGNSQQALITFRKLNQLNPRSPEPYFRLAEVYSGANDAAAAETSLRQAVAAFPDSVQAARLLIQQLMKSRKSDAALAVARSVQKQQPKGPAGFILESEIHSQSKNAEAAIAALRSGLQASSSSEVAIRLYGALAASDKAADAQAFASAWLKAHPRDVDFLQAQGDVAMQGHNNGLADQIYSDLLKIDSNNGRVLNNLSWVRLKLGRSGSVALAERALALEPKNLSYADTLAQALIAAKQTARAVEIEKAIVQAPEADPVLRLSAADLFVRAGQAQLARAELEKLGSVKGNAFVQAEVSRLRGQLKD